MKKPIILAIFATALAGIIPSVHANEWVSAITEPLRILTNEALQFDFITRFIVLLFSLGVAVIAFSAWKRKPQFRLKWIALGFGLIALKWLLKVMDLFVSSGQFFPDHAENVIELLSLASIAYAIFAPSERKG